MNVQHVDAAAIADRLPAGGTVIVQGCATASALTAGAVASRGAELPPMTFTGIQVPGVNRDNWLANDDAQFTTFFMTPELKQSAERVRFLPLCYADIRSYLEGTRLDAALISVSPPDRDGRCSFGPTVDFLAELWPRIPLRIAHINPAIPHVGEPTAIPLDAIAYAVEADEPLRELADGGGDETCRAIAAHCAGLIHDGATLQTGLGKLPGAVLRALADHRRLRLHSGLIGDAALDLIEAGAIADGHHVTAGVAIGTRRLYDALPDSGIRFRPVSHTHAAAVLGTIDGLVTINSAMAVDLFGQAYAEVDPKGWNSGPGGASDFARGAIAAGGISILVLPSTARGASRIVAPGAGLGPVSLSRNETDFVVTEHGVADLRGCSHDERAAALIAIADPDRRETLARQWHDGPGRY